MELSWRRRRTDGFNPPRVVVTSDDNHMSKGCAPRELALVVVDFLDAQNEGDVGAMRRLLARPAAATQVAVSDTKGWAPGDSVVACHARTANR